ncbi:MAG: hypothetical protein IPK71_16900 [Myxococcales bacterium]|nr:hypothetical protein [Myxococcales bacterium]
MRYVQKGPAPETITQACRDKPELDTTEKARAAFNSLDKDEVRLSLAKEQGYLCAFCERRIQTGKPGRTFGEGATQTTTHNMRIAHRTPLDEAPGSALTWENLLGSCNDSRTCDSAQHQTVITVDPTSRVSVNRVRYERRDTAPGVSEIYITSDDAAVRRDVEETLGLNGAELPRMRKVALETAKENAHRQGYGHGKPALRKYLAAQSSSKHLPHLGFLEAMSR